MSELIDLVDATGKVARRGVERNDADRYEGLYMQIVVAVITNSLGEPLVHERSGTKTVSPNHVDHVCGGILSGETPEVAVMRESLEEVTVLPSNLRRVGEELNSYNRWRVLIAATCDDLPDTGRLNTDEVVWAGYKPVAALRAQQSTGEALFVDGFFEDLEMATAPPA